MGRYNSIEESLISMKLGLRSVIVYSYVMDCIFILVYEKKKKLLWTTWTSIYNCIIKTDTLSRESFDYIIFQWTQKKKQIIMIINFNKDQSISIRFCCYFAASFLRILTLCRGCIYIWSRACFMWSRLCCFSVERKPASWKYLLFPSCYLRVFIRAEDWHINNL